MKLSLCKKQRKVHDQRLASFAAHLSLYTYELDLSKREKYAGTYQHLNGSNHLQLEFFTGTVSMRNGKVGLERCDTSISFAHNTAVISGVRELNTLVHVR